MKILKCLLFLGCVAAFASCDNPSTTTDLQQVADLAWKPDNSLVALIERTTESVAIYDPTQNFDLYQLNSDGAIGSKISAPDRSNQGYFPAIFTSSDSRAGVVELGPNIYRIDLATNTLTQVVGQSFLIGASPDLQYVIGSQSESAALTKLITIYDISVLPARVVKKFNAIGATSDRALWLDSGRVALTHSDSLQYHVSIYDTTGTLLSTIPNAVTSFHASGFSPVTHQLFVRDNNSRLSSYDLTTRTRSVVVGDASVESMDVSSDGKLLVYVAEDTLNTRSMYALNVENGHKSKLAQDVIAVRLSPTADRVAYIHLADAYNSDVKILGVTLPQ